MNENIDEVIERDLELDAEELNDKFNPTCILNNSISKKKRMGKEGFASNTSLL